MRAISTDGFYMSANRYEFVDSLRGMAILGVVVTHVGSMTLDGHAGLAALMRKITVLGGMGVPLFYLVSAFTIMLMFTKRVGREPAPLGSFFIRRFMRIAPVYWGGIALYTALYGFTNSRGWLEGPELWHYPLHLLFLNMTNPFTPSSVVPGGWSISNEMIFYVLFPALFLLVNTPRKALVFFVASVALSPLAEMAAHAIVASQFPTADAQQAKMFAYRWLPNQLSCFAAGFVFFHLFQRLTTVPALLHRVAPKITVLTLLAFLPVLIVLLRKGPIQENHLWITWFLVLAFAMYAYQWKVLVNEPLAWIGKVSFSCYIFHFAVIELVQRFLPSMSPPADFAATLTITLPITLALAWVSYRYYETFFMRQTARIVERYQERRGATASAEV
ncbi:acyltransferase [Stenotrophomonas sp. CFBP 13718]|uniref:acyltransferase family protein n=1 Tax=Stenotrophomonas sp. CFBP 13718 TaxID=2775304 RepID=UPI00177CB756|nr:acyltransferase [Stenotrophomonas sp. CFBP 13718]MBD8696610.1 acyltransferase [Stenotrophomonas sp. CFBP 13718]